MNNSVIPNFYSYEIYEKFNDIHKPIIMPESEKFLFISSNPYKITLPGKFELTEQSAN